MPEKSEIPGAGTQAHENNPASSSSNAVEYTREIASICTELEHAAVLEVPEYSERVADILGRLKEIDRRYLQTQSLEMQSQVMFTRHGQCAPWANKRFGMQPNAAIDATAESAMQQTAQYTQQFLMAPSLTPQIFISPMLRAKQTAALILPKGMRANLSMNAALSENSVVPSGSNITSYQDLVSKARTISFLQAPMRFLGFNTFRILYALRRVPIINIITKPLIDAFFGSANIFGDISEKLSTADKILAQHKVDAIGLDSSQCDDLTEEDKLKETKILLANSMAQCTDSWLIGHGKNFKTVLKTFFNIDFSFNYAETLRLYRVCDTKTGKVRVFIPPYTLSIDQTSGKVTGHLKTGQVQLVANSSVLDRLEEPTSAGGSTQRIFDRGLSPNEPSSEKAGPQEPNDDLIQAVSPSQSDTRASCTQDETITQRPG